LRNVFNPSDFETENKAWDKRRKCEFVQRLIDFAANHKQPVVGCVADKLVAGLEPSKTNELLQSLAKIAQARLNGQDGHPSRPRTFTRRASGSTSPPKQQTGDGKGASKSTQQAVAHRARGAGEKLSAHKGKNETKLQASATRNASSTVRNASPKDSKTGAGRRASQAAPTGAPAVKSTVVPNNANDDTQVDEAGGGPKGGPPPKIGPANIAGAPSHVTKQSVSKVSSSFSGPSQSSQSVVVCESDIGRSIQQLRSDLDHLRANLVELGQFDVKFRARFAEFMENDNQ
jgi:hypothetical protein